MKGEGTGSDSVIREDAGAILLSNDMNVAVSPRWPNDHWLSRPPSLLYIAQRIVSQQLHGVVEPVYPQLSQ
jgi:hypothetical protein